MHGKLIRDSGPGFFGDKVTMIVERWYQDGFLKRFCKKWYVLSNKNRVKSENEPEIC